RPPPRAAAPPAPAPGRRAHLPPQLSLLIDRVIEFPQQDVAHAMVPRSRVDIVAADATIADVRRTMAEGHTRYPVVDAEGMPIGVVDMAAVLRAAGDAQRAPVSTIMRRALVVPELMPLPDALDQLARERHQLACVVDEYGGFAGILTNEDLAEELVGVLTDEHDAAPQVEAVPIGDDAWLMDGDVHLDEVRRAVGHELPDTDVETLAGLVIEARGALPEVGERVEIELPADPTEIVEADRDRRAISVDVVAVENHVPSRLRVRVVHLSDQTPEEER
ncbi:CBS domain-containing protein, partial [Alcanivoracaceae bacterium MT1]